MKKHELCNHCFSKKSSLLNHVASIHEEKKHLECEICDKKCSVKSNLNINVIRAVVEGVEGGAGASYEGWRCKSSFLRLLWLSCSRGGAL